MNEAKRKKANLVQLLIKQGWNPPTPTNRIVERIADDMERVNSFGSAEAGTEATLELSPAQLRVIALAAEGYTGTESAQLLGKSHETIKGQLKAAMHRLGAKNQAHAVAICIRNGLIDPGGNRHDNTGNLPVEALGKVA